MWDTKEIEEYIYIYIAFGGNCSSASVIRVVSEVEVCGEENRKEGEKGGGKTDGGGVD